MVKVEQPQTTETHSHTTTSTTTEGHGNESSTSTSTNTSSGASILQTSLNRSYGRGGVTKANTVRSFLDYDKRKEKAEIGK